MAMLDTSGMVNCAVHFVRIRERNGTFSTGKLRKWFMAKGHGEYINDQGGITSVGRAG